MGCKVDWDGNFQQVDVFKDGESIMTLWIDDDKMWTANGYKILDVPARVINNRTLVPVRAISESMGADVDWDGRTQTVIITLDEASEIRPMAKLYQYDDENMNSAYITESVILNDTEYNITVVRTQKYDWNFDTTDKFEFTLNGAKLYFDAYFLVNDIYLCDLNPDDQAVELLISVISDSEVNTMYAYQYENGDIRPLKFYNTRVVQEDSGLELFLGSNYNGIIMNKDHSITMTGRTGSHGMWGIRKTFRLDGNNRIAQDTQDMYEIDIYEFMQSLSMPYEALIQNHYIDSDAEYYMYLNNYALCKRDYGCLKKGDYFTVVYDDDNGNIYVRTIDGKEGWIYIKSLYTQERESISKLMFYLAS